MIRLLSSLLVLKRKVILSQILDKLRSPARVAT
jgi:hypothetical protein